jgi:hypothetical protein
MHDGDVGNWEDFESRIRALRQQYPRERALVFRGLGDSRWPLTTTLERHGSKGMPFADYYGVISSSEPQIRTFAATTWDEIESYVDISERSSGYYFERSLSGGLKAYGYMAYLRHQGFPSPLLDWTRSPYIAAFFAFRSAIKPPHDRVSEYVFCETPTGMKGGGTGESAIIRLGPYVRAHRRHFLQQGEYTICLRWDPGVPWRFVSHEDVFDGTDDTQDLIWKFNIPFSERTKVLKLLDDYNLNAFSLFDSDEALLETIALRRLTFGQNPDPV